MSDMLENRERKPWLKYYPKETLLATPPQGSLLSYVQEKCRERQAYGINAMYYFGKYFTYRELFVRIAQYAKAFWAMGVRPGEYVTFVTVGIPESVFAFYGLNRIGAAANFIDPRTDAEHIGEFTRKAGSKVLICIENIWDKVMDIAEEMDHVIIQSASDSLPFFRKMGYKFTKKKPQIDFYNSRNITNQIFVSMGDNLSMSKLPDDTWGADQPAAVTRTGGTTGVSKGVVLTNGSINAVVDGAAKYGLRTKDGEKLLNFLPIAASYGVVCGVHLIFGMSQTDIMVPVFKPEDFCDLVYRYRPNTIVGVPVFYEGLLHDRRFRKMDLSFLKHTLAGGDSPNANLEDELEGFFISHHVPYGLAKGYGLSEVSSACALGIYENQRKGSVGIPFPYTDIAIFEPNTDDLLPIGEIGEICISGPSLMKEYLFEPEETAHIVRMHSDGEKWVHSGDIGYLDSDGFLYIKGRIKRSIVRFDGHKSYPVQIENVVSKHPDVTNCSVIPVKDLDHDQGDLPLIIAQPVPEYTGDLKILGDQIMDFCSRKIEGRSLPAGIIMTRKLPLNNMGKIDLQKLSKKYYHYNYQKNKKADRP